MPVNNLIGLGSLVAGLLLSALNLIFYHRTVRKQRLDIAKTEVDLELQRRTVQQARPDFSVYYVEVSDEGWHDVDTTVTTRGGFWRHPLLRNAVFRAMADRTPSQIDQLHCREPGIDKKLSSGEYRASARTAVLLVVEQTGKSKATHVRLAVKCISFDPTYCTEIFEADDLNVWATSAVSLGGRVAEDNIEIGDLDTGKGILVPLLIRTHCLGPGPFDWFSISEGPLLVPLHLVFSDSLDGSTREFPIRDMLDVPQQLSARVVTRG